MYTLFTIKSSRPILGQKTKLSKTNAVISKRYRGSMKDLSLSKMKQTEMQREK